MKINAHRFTSQLSPCVLLVRYLYGNQYEGCLGLNYYIVILGSMAVKVLRFKVVGTLSLVVDKWY